MPAIGENMSQLDLAVNLEPLLSQVTAEDCPHSSFHSLNEEEMPEVFRGLLCHQGDMTSTLEHFFEDEIAIHALNSRMESDVYSRRVLLFLKRSGRCVEYRGIQINLDAFPEEARQLILEEKEPLCAILNKLKIPHHSQPDCYMWIKENPSLNLIFPHDPAEPLYGRCNRLKTPEGQVLAKAVEIMPALDPTDGKERR